MKNRFYMTSPHSWCGSNVMFHAASGGYTSNIDEAEEFSHEHAQKEVSNGWCRNCNEQEMPLSADHVDDLAVWHVDHQYIKQTYPEFKDKNDEYVAYSKGVWDGNDLQFASVLGSSFDYSDAKSYSGDEIAPYFENGKKNESWVFVPKSHTDEIARRTIDRKNVNRRVMVQGAGIKGMTKPRNRNTSGKTRMNCPSCGRMAWQYNPHDFNGCANLACDEWKSDYDRSECFYD